MRWSSNGTLPRRIPVHRERHQNSKRRPPDACRSRSTKSVYENRWITPNECKPLWTTLFEMTILQRTPNLPGKFSCDPLPQSSVTDLVQHLTSTGILENNIVVMLVYHFSHATNVGVMEKHGRGGAKSTNLLGGIFGPLEDCRDAESLTRCWCRSRWLKAVDWSGL